MIGRLPDELLGLIASELSQSDCYHLILTNKTIYHASLPRLYDSIVVDSTNQVYHKELINFNDIVVYKNKKYKSTVIKTCNGLKQFFKTLQRNESLVHLINYLRVIKLPDHFIEIELVKCFQFLFAKLDNLKGCDFQYNSCFINLNNLIPLLLHQERLVELIGDFTTSVSLKKKNMNGLTSLCAISETLELQKFALINFQSSCFLEALKLPRTILKLSICKNQPSTFPINYNLVNSIGIDFNYLQDCFNKYFYNVMTNETQIDLSSISNRQRHTIRPTNSDVDLNTIRNLFKENHHRLNLKELKLDGITFNIDDDRIMVKHLNLNSLQKLTIIDCCEPYNTEVLTKISPFLINLKELNISFDRYQDVSKMIHVIKNLEKLYISIKDPENTWDCFQLFKVLQRHKNLTRLIIDSNCESHLKSIPIKILEKKLTRLSQLLKLRLTISIKHLSRFIYNVLPYLPQLQFLEIVLEEFNVINNAGLNSSAYMVEETIYENDDNDFEFDMDELCPNLLTLSKIKKINAQILNMGQSLQYVKIFNVLLTNNNIVKERGLENWFTEKLL